MVEKNQDKQQQKVQTTLIVQIMYLLDTDIVIWALRGRQEVVKKISRLKENFPTSISVVTIAEIYMNIFPSELRITEDFLHQNIIFQVDEVIAKEAGLYWNHYFKKYKKLGITDCLIAATAKVKELEIITLNTRHFPMKDIKVINPLK